MLFQPFAQSAGPRYRIPLITPRKSWAFKGMGNGVRGLLKGGVWRHIKTNQARERPRPASEEESGQPSIMMNNTLQFIK
ncbi:hypothetical protein OPQ81_009148 [Rhizoctonia solani]|nr:hypothetical protein OPQ81_009148 [Rhizoctonia solani]